jgi:hypothetical protein
MNDALHFDCRLEPNAFRNEGQTMQARIEAMKQQNWSDSDEFLKVWHMNMNMVIGWDACSWVPCRIVQLLSGTQFVEWAQRCYHGMLQDCHAIR